MIANILYVSFYLVFAGNSNFTLGNDKSKELTLKKMISFTHSMEK